jgi:Asp-tRNA(Asn)/Glu-tRNA(Gln) amidotransferase B subunit
VGTPEHDDRAARYRGLGLKPVEAGVLADNRALAEFFEDVLTVYDNPKAVASWVVNDVIRELKDRDLAELPFSAKQIGSLVRLVVDGVVSRTIAKDVLAVMARDGGDPDEIIQERGLEQVSDTAAIQTLVDKVIARHAEEVGRYREGKTALLGFFVGQVMKESGGKASPALVGQMIQEKLG